MSEIRPIITTRRLSKIFHAGKPNEIAAVRDIDLEILPNTCTLLQGASGSGKTTLLALLSGLAKPTSGEYCCLGEPISRWSERFLTDFRRRHLGIVFQRFHLVSGLTAAENIVLPLLPMGGHTRAIQARAREVADQVGISHRLGQRVEQLSGGEAQRVAIARALIMQPSILLADEPTAHLDGASAGMVLEIFEQLRQAGKTLIITTHDPRVAQQLHIDRTLTMYEGRLE